MDLNKSFFQKCVTDKLKLRQKGRKQFINNLKLDIMGDVLVPIALFLMIFAILYVYYTTRSRERLALVEKGADANIFKTDPVRKRLDLVKWGIFLIALGLGVVGGFALSNAINEVVAFFTSILVCGGIGLIVAYFVTNKLAKNED